MPEIFLLVIHFLIRPSIVQLPAMSKTNIADVIESGEHDQYVVKDKLDDTTRPMFNNLMDFQKRYMFSSCAHTPDEVRVDYQYNCRITGSAVWGTFSQLISVIRPLSVRFSVLTYASMLKFILLFSFTLF